jgi:hypothetical protein
MMRMIGQDDIGPIFAEETEDDEKERLLNFRDTGGPAFPNGDSQYGMRLRDYLAAHAMQAIFHGPRGSTIGDCDAAWMMRVADKAYEMADAMLARRDRK